MSDAHSNDKVRTLIVWEVPTLGSSAFIEMYVNPKSIEIREGKIINTVRTKGGFINQYWGEELVTAAIRGSTGTGGIEALNVVRDVYRSEQLALQKILQSRGASSKRRQSLAQLAASVVMWYQGQGFRGFFKDFSYTEAAEMIGLFDYSLTFVVTQIIGKRKNYLEWQRKPWSTMDTPSYDDGTGSMTGGAYNTKYKIGELNAPAVNEDAGLLSDPEFTSRSGLTFVPGTSEYKTLESNLAENADPLTPESLFASKK